MERHDMLVPLAVITLLGFALRVYGLSAQPLSADDIAVALTAMNYAEMGNLGPTMWNHPNLRSLLVYFALVIFGPGVWGMKIVSLTLGTLSIPVLGLTAKRILNDHKAALLAAFFLATDALHIDFSRQAINEVYMMFFSLCGILLALKFSEGRKTAWLIFSGIMFGLGIASKWYAAFPLWITASYLVYGVWKGRQDESKTSVTLFIFSALLILPLLVYLLTYIPWMHHGYGIADWLSLQKSMSLETATHGGYNLFRLDFDHKAYLWFLKPVAFGDIVFTESTPVLLLGISNPLVWLLALPSTLYLLYRGTKAKTAHYVYLVLLFWLSYIPFLLAARPIWAHTAFSVIPFAFMAISFSIFSVLDNKRYRRNVLIAYLCSVVAATIPLYILAIGKGYETDYLRPIVESYRPQNDR